MSTDAPLPPPRDWRPVVAAVLARPSLWPTALRQAMVLAVPGWWHRWPPLPLPDRDYLAFRLLTAYGRSDHPPEPADVVAYLRWCRSWRRAGWGDATG